MEWKFGICGIWIAGVDYKEDAHDDEFVPSDDEEDDEDHEKELTDIPHPSAVKQGPYQDLF